METTYTQTLRGGGSITIVFELDWLSAPLDDLTFVRDLYDQFQAYPPTEQLALPAAPQPPDQPAATPSKPANVGGRPSTVDYAAVARVALDARRRGISQEEAVAAHYGISHGAARSRLKKARKKGGLDKLPANGGSEKTTKVDFDELADYVRSLNLTGMPLCRAVANHYGLTEHAARWRVQEARRRGILERVDPPAPKVRPTPTPARAPKPTAVAPVKPEPKFVGDVAQDWDLPDRKPAAPVDPNPPVVKVYRCECGEQLPTELELAKHTTSRHGRPPRATEQTKVAAA